MIRRGRSCRPDPVANGNGIEPGIDVSRLDEPRCILSVVPEVFGRRTRAAVKDYGPFGDLGHGELASPRPLRVVGCERDQSAFQSDHDGIEAALIDRATHNRHIAQPFG